MNFTRSGNSKSGLEVGLDDRKNLNKLLIQISNECSQKWEKMDLSKAESEKFFKDFIVSTDLKDDIQNRKECHHFINLQRDQNVGENENIVTHLSWVLTSFADDKYSAVSLTKTDLSDKEVDDTPENLETLKLIFRIWRNFNEAMDRYSSYREGLGGF